MDLSAFFKISYGLYIISSAYEGKKAGCIVNTLAQVTAEPPHLSVCVSKENYTTELIGKSGVFAGTVLTKQVPLRLIGEFGFKSSRDIDKFANLHAEIDPNGVPYVTDYAAAQFSCKVVGSYEIGDHRIFIGEVQQAQKLSEDEVLTYDEYHRVKKGTTPKNAPSYQPKEKKQSSYRCKICGYIYQGESLPEDFVCPICGKTKEYFEKI